MIDLRAANWVNRRRVKEPEPRTITEIRSSRLQKQTFSSPSCSNGFHEGIFSAKKKLVDPQFQGNSSRLASLPGAPGSQWNREKRSLSGRSGERRLMAEVVQQEEHQVEKIPSVSRTGCDPDHVAREVLNFPSKEEDLRTMLKRNRDRREDEDMRTRWKKSRGNERREDNVKKVDLSELKLSRVGNFEK